MLDFYNREIISYSISISSNFDSIKDLLVKAFQKYDDLTGLIIHSDLGWQYVMQSYHKALEEKTFCNSCHEKAID